MAASRRDTPSKSFFSSPSNTLKNFMYGTVGGFSKPKKQELVEEVEPIPEVTYEHAPTSVPVPTEDENESSADDEADTGYSYSSDDNYPRPRIREDLLPHDFSEWQKSSCGSVAPSTASEASSTSKETESFSEVLSTSTSGTSQERHSDNGRSKLYRVPSSTELPDGTLSCKDRNAAARHVNNSRQMHGNSAVLKSEGNGQVSGANVIARYGGKSSLRSLSENRKGWISGVTQGEMGSVDGWKGIVGRAAAGGQLRRMMQELAGTRDVGNIDMELYQNLIEMFPLIETFVEHPEYRQRRKFQHHASMVYTRAPARNANVKKIKDGVKNVRNHGRVNGKNDSVWEDRGDMLPQVEEDESSLSPESESYDDGDSASDVAKLQSEVDELQRKLAEREAMLETTVERKNAEAMDRARKLEDLQSKVAEKERLWATVNEKLVQKEDEISGIERLLQRTEEGYAGLRERSASSEEEVRSLRCEVAALRWQMEVESNRALSECFSSDPTSPHSRNLRSVQKMTDHSMGQCDAVSEEQQVLDLEEMEAARKMYLAAIVAAKHNPVEECLVLVGELRMHLQSFLNRPTFHGGLILCS